MSNDFMDEARKAVAGAARAAALSGNAYSRALAGELFMQQSKPQFTIPEIPAILECFSARRAVADIAKEIEALKANAPENKHLDITMRTPDGRIMAISMIKPVGFSVILAEGFIDNLPCTVMAHVSTLNLFFAYVEARSNKPRVGFIIEVPEAETIEPQPESAQPQPDTKKPARQRAKQ